MIFSVYIQDVQAKWPAELAEIPAKDFCKLPTIFHKFFTPKLS